MMIQNNKERAPLEHYKKIYMQLDPKEVSERCQVPYSEDSGRFSLRLMGEGITISHPNFAIYNNTDTQIPDSPTSILLIRFLIEGRVFAATRQDLTYRDIPDGQAYYTNFLGRCIKRLARSCGTQLEQFSMAMEYIGAKRVNMGDCAYRFEFVDNLYMTFILWEGDEEFPPSAQILFDNNFPLAFSAEDIAVIGDISIDSICRRMQKI